MFGDPAIQGGQEGGSSLLFVVEQGDHLGFCARALISQRQSRVSVTSTLGDDSLASCGHAHVHSHDFLSLGRRVMGVHEAHSSYTEVSVIYWLHFPRTLIEPRQAEIRKECLQLWGVSVPPTQFRSRAASFREGWD